ncbi:MAG: hypothetical protein AAB590_01690 [Patescibacteria group bacterium]
MRQKVRDIFKPRTTLGIELKGRTDNLGELAINHYCLGARIIKIANRCRTRILTPLHLLAQSSLGVLGKRIHIVFALTKGNIEHELTLRGILHPKRRELEARKNSRIKQVDQSSPVY